MAASSSGSSGIGYQSIFQQWKNLDLTSLQKELDETAAELANRQDESENSRKKLVDLSKDFKKNTPEDVRKQVTPLLKSFQAEIDNLSKRSKSAEASFLTLYKKIIEAPDPVPAMDHLSQTQKKAQRCAELELENKNLRSTLDQYNTEFAEVRNQEVTIRQLKEKIKILEEQTDSIVNTRVSEQETASKRFYEDREHELNEENESLSQKLKEAEERSNALQTSLNAAQKELFVLRSRGDELGSAKTSEYELILNDAERANQRADTAEKECELLKEKIENLEETVRRAQSIPGFDSSVDDGEEDEANDGPDGEKREKKGRIRSKISSLELELTSKDKQIGQLLEELKQANGKLIDNEKRHQNENSELQRELESTQIRLQAVETILEDQSDYEEIKRELNILKTIELGGTEGDDDDDDDASFDRVQSSMTGKGQKGGSGGKSLEMLLLEKNKALQDENASLRNANRGLNELNRKLESENSSMIENLSKQKELIVKLEEDLLRMNDFRRPEAVGAESPDDVTKDFLTKAVSPGGGGVAVNTRGTDGSAADSLLPIVAGQRERFRQRVQELEEQNLQYQQHMALLQTEIDRSRADNVKLYEKIKFLQSYRGGSGNQTNVPIGDDQTLEKYSSEYEQSLDPFRRFNAQERQRKYQSLRTHDKATLRISRIIMSSGAARAFFFFYLLFLHCLVFLVLYKTAYTESCKRDSDMECIQKFKEHMNQVHGDPGHGHHSG